MRAEASPATRPVPRHVGRLGLACWQSYALFSLCAAAFLLPFMRTLFIGSDEGTFLVGAVRILHGQVFARDFFEVMGPGAFYWMAAFFRLFGVSFLAARICLFVSLFATCIALYFLSRQVCNRYQALPCLMLAGPYFGFLGQVESHHVDGNVFALLAVACIFQWSISRKFILLMISGALAGVTACFLQPKGALLLLAFALWQCRMHRKPRPLLTSLTALAAGFLAVIAAMLVYFWSQNALSQLYYANVFFPSHRYAAVNRVSYAQGIDVSWAFWVARPDGFHWPAIVGAILVLPAIFVAALPVSTLVLGIGYRWKAARPEIALLGLCGIALWLSEFHRMDIHHLAYGSPLLAIVFFHLLERRRTQLTRFAAPALAACAVCLVLFNWCAAVGIPSLPTRVGTAGIFGPGVAPTLAYLNRNVAAGTEIFVYPYSPAYYFLSETTNPTPYSFLLHGYNTTEQYANVIEILELRKVPYVVWDTKLESRLLDELPSGSKVGYHADSLLEPYLRSHYRTVALSDSVQILERI